MHTNGRKNERLYWGCGDKNHAYATMDEIVTCPRSNEPQVQKNDKEARKKYVAKMKEKRNSRKKRFAQYLFQAISYLKKKDF